MYESLYPVRVTKQEIRRDSVGAGEYRGGAGVDYECEVFVPTEHSYRAEGLGRPTGFGVNAGSFGAGGRFDISVDGGAWQEAPRYGVGRCGPMRIRIASAGGGGYGDPLRRDRAAVRRDVEDGVISPEIAIAVYGL